MIAREITQGNQAEPVYLFLQSALDSNLLNINSITLFIKAPLLVFILI
mgnify:CR=1